MTGLTSVGAFQAEATGLIEVVVEVLEVDVDVDVEAEGGEVAREGDVVAEGAGAGAAVERVVSEVAAPAALVVVVCDAVAAFFFVFFGALAGAFFFAVEAAATCAATRTRWWWCVAWWAALCGTFGWLEAIAVAGARQIATPLRIPTAIPFAEALFGYTWARQGELWTFGMPK